MMFEKLEPLTKVDPLFLYELIYVCPRNDFKNLIPKVSPFLCIAFRAKELENCESVEKNEVCYV